MTAQSEAGRSVALELPLTPGERAVLADGGLLAHLRASGRSPIAHRPELAVV